MPKDPDRMPRKVLGKGLSALLPARSATPNRREIPGDEGPGCSNLLLFARQKPGSIGLLPVNGAGVRRVWRD